MAGSHTQEDTVNERVNRAANLENVGDKLNCDSSSQLQ
jgi:hypothetical protein